MEKTEKGRKRIPGKTQAFLTVKSIKIVAEDAEKSKETGLGKTNRSGKDSQAGRKEKRRKIPAMGQRSFGRTRGPVGQADRADPDAVQGVGHKAAVLTAVMTGSGCQGTGRRRVRLTVRDQTPPRALDTRQRY